MALYKSETRTVNHSIQKVFISLSDFNRLKPLSESFSNDKIKEVSIENDSIRFKMEMIGDLGLSVASTIEPTQIFYSVDNAPIPMEIKVLLKEIDGQNTTISLEIEADIPMMVKPMIEKPLTEFLDKTAQVLSEIPYEIL